MSQSTKRKHVTKEVLDEFVLPDQEKEVVKVIAGRGNNLHEVLSSNGVDKFLVSMPTKFRKNVWIKRGDYVLIEAVPEGEKVKGIILNILYKEQIKYIKRENLWPVAFSESDNIQKKSTSLPEEEPASAESLSEDDDDDDLFQNNNRQVVEVSDDESTDDEEEEKNN